MSVESDLIMASARLARSAPGAWEEFLGALSAHSDKTVSDCIRSPVYMLEVQQGRAQLSVHLLSLFKTCLSTAAKIEDRQ